MATVWKVGDDSERSDYSNFSFQRKKGGDSITTRRQTPLGESTRTKSEGHTVHEQGIKTRLWISQEQGCKDAVE